MDGIHQTRNMQNTAAAMKRGSASAPDAGSADSDEPRSAQATGSAASEGTVLSVASKADSESMPPRKKMRMTRDEQVERIAGAVGTILECLDDDPSREGLLKTPERYAKVRWPRLFTPAFALELTLRRHCSRSQRDTPAAQTKCLVRLNLMSATQRLC